MAHPAVNISRWAAIALGASIPVSTALDNVLLVIVLAAWAAWAASGPFRAIDKKTLKNNALMIPLMLFGLLAVGMLWSNVTLREALSQLWKYADLLFIPLFAMVFRDRETRLRGLYAFAAAMVITLVLSYLFYARLVPQWPFFASDGISPTVFKYKITHSILVAYAAYLFVWFGDTATRRRTRLVWYTLALFAAGNVLLLVQGATGYVVLGALALLLAIQRTGRRELAAVALLAVVGVTALAFIPSPFQQRIVLIKSELHLWASGDAKAQDTSTGLRLDFHKNTLSIIAAHPLTGVGTGGFPKAYAEQVKGTGKYATHNPHNEFLNIAAQIGLGGMVVLIALFWAQWRAVPQLATPMEQALARALVLTLVVGCLVNSLLLDHAEGLFYAWMSGLLYGGLKYGPSEPLARV